MILILHKKCLLICLSLVLSLRLSADFYKISGKVTNSAMEPLAYVEVILQENHSIRTTTDIEGNYSLEVTEGSYVLVFALDGFKATRIPVTINESDLVQNCVMEIASQNYRKVKISGKKNDISESIIRKAIDMKYKYMYSGEYTVDAYIKAKESSENTNSKAKENSDSSKQAKGPGSLTEVFLTVHFAPPDKIKEERTGVEVRGSKSGLFYLTHTDGNFNFYKNLVQVRALSESPFLSPISHSGLIAYKFKMLSIFYENGIKYYRIKVQPGKLGNALVSGELVIQDSTWNIQSLDLSFPKYHMVEYDEFSVKQTYELLDSHYMIKSQEFNYSAKFGKSKSSGRTVVYYTNYRMNQTFKKRFFNSELSATLDSAYERDSSFWLTLRKEPLSHEELSFIRRSDSVRALHSQKYWQDSTDSVYNRLTFMKMIFTGQGNYKRSAERYWSFKPLAFLYTPVYIAGPRLNYWVYYAKTSKTKRNTSIFPTVNFGLINEDLKGSLSVFRLYDPFRRMSYSVSAGSDFNIINPNASWLELFRRNNFYTHDYVHASHRMEVVNGLYFNVGAEFANRRPISNLKFDPRGDQLWSDSNTTVDFDYYKATYATLSLFYTPFQRYIREPYQKVILGSSWPEFGVLYRKGMPNGISAVDFDYLEFQVEQEIRMGLAGVGKYRASSGEFLNTKDLRLVDYKFQRATGKIFFANPLYSFQGMDSSYATFKRFYEGHYLHRFNGAIINKIPLLKKLNIIEVAGAGLLYTNERNLRYAEMFVGFEKIIRVFKERLRIGVFFVAAQSNQFSYPSRVKFTIESYDKVKNKWPY